MFISILKHVVDVLRQWNEYQDSVAQLSRMTDVELRDIGISRGDIHRVAYRRSER